tara:strand:+ start:856 stop:1035 length:180 start_codon:yes stop_codon:yes gene_type:complete
MPDFKVYALNAFSLIISFSQIENGLKVILLMASIVYTIQRIYQGYLEKKEKKPKNEKNK